MSITYRPGSSEDNFAVYSVFAYTVAEQVRRLGFSDAKELPTEAEIASGWERRRSLYEHLTNTAEQFWVAEQGGEIIGYSRTQVHEGVQELTEFFVLPNVQAKGIGSKLLERAFPRTNARRLVIAAPEVRAQALYMRSGVYARHLIYDFFSPSVERTTIASDLAFAPMVAAAVTFEQIAEIDRHILGFRRDADHRWLMAERQGWLYLRQGQIVGYGYIGDDCGPFALLHPEDFPAVLAHAETQIAASGRNRLDLSVHSTNRHAVDYLLRRGFRVGPYIATLLSDAPLGRLDHYINTNPPFFL